MTERRDQAGVPVRAASLAPTVGPLRRADLRRAIRARILPFAIYILFLIVADLLAWLGVERATLRWLYPLQIGAVLALLIVMWR